MAYAVLTLLQSVAGGRKEAVKTFKVNARILESIARLSSTKGDAATIRKFRSWVYAREPVVGCGIELARSRNSAPGPQDGGARRLRS